MLIIHVFLRVKAEHLDAFRSATLMNAKTSLLEPGVARFDVLQQADDPTRFLLVEVYRTEEDPARHKETTHYQVWRTAVAKMMAEPRTSLQYLNVFPDESGWG
jgi:quinol monooxygenase YgiN